MQEGTLASRKRWRIRFIARICLAAFCVAVGVTGVWLVRRWRVPPMPRIDTPVLPVAWVDNGAVKMKMPSGYLLGEVGQYDDELTAYLRFEYLRGLKTVSAADVLMTSTEIKGEPRYRLYIILPNDIFHGAEYLATLEIGGFIDGFELVPVPEVQVSDWRKQTSLFYAAYSQPVRERLLSLPAEYLTSAVARFILFKVKTDRRVRERIEPAPAALSEEQSLEFAADMIEVAKFYQVPLSMLLGVGAMENNYLDVRGDLKHTVWKRRAQPGDIVLKRRKGRVLVSNYSIGPWQITRETLRYVHALYLKDKRDYNLLPERLRPPKKLDLNQVDAHVLTTYAGLLLRQLLDHFDGNVEKAVGAYNGGAGNPNAQYAEGVSMVATYAHRVLGMAAARKGIAVSETELKVSRVPTAKSASPDRSEAETPAP